MGWAGIESIQMGRPPKRYPEFLCPRVNLLRQLFQEMDGPTWVEINRPLEKPYDQSEEKARRVEYSRLLQRFNHSELMGKCEPGESGYPALILRWQYQEGLLGRGGKAEEQNGLTRSLLGAAPKDVVEYRSEYTRRLAFFLVSQEARIPEEYLVKLCRKWDPNAPDAFQWVPIDFDEFES